MKTIYVYQDYKLIQNITGFGTAIYQLILVQIALSIPSVFVLSGLSLSENNLIYLAGFQDSF